MVNEVIDTLSEETLKQEHLAMQVTKEIKHPAGTHIGMWYDMCRGHHLLSSGQSVAAHVSPHFQFLEKNCVFGLVLTET